MGGEDQANSLRQIVQFGLTQDMAVGGALFELESILAVPDAARIGWWTMEWWWNQPNVPQIKAFDAAIRSRTGKAASARNWFGYAAVRTLAQVANQEKSLDPVVLARALQGYTLPADIALDADRAFFRDRDHELMSTVLVGEVHPPRDDPFDVFTVRAAVKAEDAAGRPTQANAGWRFRAEPARLLRTSCAGGAGPDLNLVAVGQIDRRIEDHLIAVLDAGAHLDRRAEIAHHGHCADMRATPFSTTATLRPSRLKMIASDGTISDGVLRGIFSSTVQ